MRHLIASAALVLTALPALGADMAGPPPVLRGALPADAGVDFAGGYFGGFAGYNAQVFNTSNTPVSPAAGYATTPYSAGNAHLARPVDRSSAGAMGFGVFAGFNWGIDGYIVGVEADYVRSRLKGGSRGSLTGGFDDGTNEYQFTTNVATTQNVTDYGTLRARLGLPYGNFMPYVTGGLAWARTQYGNSASLTGSRRPTGSAPGTPYTADPTAPGPLATATRSQMIYGYALGAGVEFALTSNILLRGEVMTMRFARFGGFTSPTSSAPDGNMSINTARVGAAVKF
ncbi:MAG: outer membrane protein [Beijerinckiaceae bacterium]